MKSLRKTSAAAAALALSLVLAACGGSPAKDQPSDDKTDASSEASNGETSETTSDEGGGPAGDTSVKIGITQIVSHPALDAARDGFKKALEDAGYDATYDEQNAQGDQTVAASIAGNFADADLDLILAIATPTAQAVAQAVKDTPVVFTAITEPQAAGLVDSWEKPGANITGTSDKNPVKEQLEMLLEIAPDVKTVGIVYSSAEENSIVQVGWANEAASELGLEIKEATVANSADVQQAAEALNVDAFYVPTDNTVVSALEALIQVAEQRKIPAIAAEGDSVARGTIATLGLSYYALGYQSGQMAVKILSGEAKPADMPVETQAELLVYLNLSAAERMGVTIPDSLLERALPENITR